MNMEEKKAAKEAARTLKNAGTEGTSHNKEAKEDKSGQERQTQRQQHKLPQESQAGHCDGPWEGQVKRLTVQFQ